MLPQPELPRFCSGFWLQSEAGVKQIQNLVQKRLFFVKSIKIAPKGTNWCRIVSHPPTRKKKTKHSKARQKSPKHESQMHSIMYKNRFRVFLQPTNSVFHWFVLLVCLFVLSGFWCPQVSFLMHLQPTKVVFCEKLDFNIILFDFQGLKHPGVNKKRDKNS